jgi:NADH dehydrogenase
MATDGTRPEVVILGGGFGGLAAARALSEGGADRFPRPGVTLIDRHIYSTFQPLLYQVATGGLNPGDVAYPIRSFASRHTVRYRHGTVARIDAAGRRVVLADGFEVPYDYLVVAVGADVNYFGVPGAAEHSAALYTRGESLDLRDALMGRLERLASRAGPGATLSVVVVGGGPTGVEMAGALAELRSAGLRAAYPELDPGTLRVLLVEQGDRLLASFTPRLSRYTLRQLCHRGVEVRFHTAITEVGPAFVCLADGSSLPADLTVWAAGVTVPARVRKWGLPEARDGRILVTGDLRVQGHERIFAVGDVAVDPDRPLPQLAQPAIQMGEHAGGQILRLVAGRSTQQFRYHDKGTMAAIGRRAAVVQLPSGIKLTGTVAWLAWLGLHIVYLLGNRNRASALLNLSTRYLFWPNAAGVIVGDIREADEPPGAPATASDDVRD